MIYIDNSATTKQYPQVTETMMKYMEEYFGNPSSMYQLGLDSEKAVKHAQKTGGRGYGSRKRDFDLHLWRDRSG